MNILALLSLVTSLLGGVAATLNKRGLVDAAALIQGAIDKINQVHDTEITKAQLEGLRITDWPE